MRRQLQRLPKNRHDLAMMRWDGNCFWKVTNRPTDQQTNRQTGQKQYVPHYYRLGVGLGLGLDIHKTNVLTKFHDDWTKMKKTPLAAMFKETNVLTKFDKDWEYNVSYRLFTCFHYKHIEKTAQPPGGHVFPMYITIFKLVQDIHITNAKIVTSREKDPPGCHETYVLTKFHEDWTKNVTFRVFTYFHYIHIEKTAPPPGGHVFSPIWTILELIRDIHETNVLTKFHDDWTKIVTSRVFTRNTSPPPGGHVFQRSGTIFELNQHIIKTNILTKLHEDWASNVTYTVFTRFFFCIIGANVLTKFHEDRTINVASRVFTRQNVDDGRTTDARPTDDGQKAIPKAHHEHCDGQTDTRTDGRTEGITDGQCDHYLPFFGGIKISNCTYQAQ
ncbi:hypothetical protein DPMN_167026 [Dreissena polymorpha]|uniref:Uncharacterized protein n=1 Tax=Dreissena polymorpha TaxID=45954 RepID=A0A9D4F0M5_DREPO|nr:hypothetical protein DPMN_167026 [Dreissena polymorpha]